MTILEELCIRPTFIGPVWARNEAGQFILPEFTLGWQIIRWVKANCLDDDGKPFTLTNEQARFILWWYAVDERGIFVYRQGVLQRLKGWGKDPLAAVMAAVEFVGPCRFAGWATRDMPELGLAKGDPVAKPHPRAWIQVAAVSIEQTQNTMKIFAGLFTKECISEHSINLGKEVIYAYGGQRTIKAVTSSPRSLEGGRATFVIKNETHHWIASNEGHEMAAVIERNATKSKDGAARTLSITNAYDPAEDSVAQKEREAWENEHAGLAIDTGVLYDSIEAPEGASLRPPREPGSPEPSEDEIKAYLGAIILAIRGDATWLNVERIVASILDRNNPPSRSRRFWLNQIVAAEDAWVTPAAVEASTHELVETLRREFGEPGDALRSSWNLISSQDELAMFFDGSKSDDATALVGCRLSDGMIFTFGVWQKPPGDRGKGWVVPRWDVQDRVKEVFDRFNIVAFWADPSHTQDDEGVRFWDDMIDGWHRAYGDRLRYWSQKGGDNQHAVMWDMTSPARLSLFVAAAELFVTEMEHKDELERPAPLIVHDGHPALKAHLKNARRFPTKYGVSLWKGHRESAKKIDLAVAAVGARMLRRFVLNKGTEDKPVRSGAVWGVGFG